MQARDTVHITPAEWRWVVLIGGILVLVAFTPFLWVTVSGATGQNWQFMGILNNYRDGATYLAKMRQGMEGVWLIQFQHTPETHNGAFIQVLYPALGQVARLIGLEPIAVFHAARVVASLIMYLTIYYLGATIWTRIRTRRSFFLMAAVSSGLGWLFAPLTGDTSFPDLTVPELYPFYSSLMNVHFPLTIACLSLLVSIVLLAFRPGATDDPRVDNGGLMVSLLSFALAVLYPQALVPIGIAVSLYVVIFWFRQRHFSMRELHWLMVMVLPALPVAAYYAAIVAYNPAISKWNQQNITATPSPLIMALGIGIPLLIALPGIYRAIRRFEPDGDQLMLIWLLAILVVIYLPLNIQRRFAVGLMLPVAYFATRSLTDFWFRFVNRRWRYWLLILVTPLITLSPFVVLVSNLNIMTGPFLERDYRSAFDWLQTHTQPNDVVLAAEDVSLWLPGWTGVRVVYGHPYETLDAVTKEREVVAWYQNPGDQCETLLQAYQVRYVIVGPRERALGEARCADQLTLTAQSGSVSIYAP